MKVADLVGYKYISSNAPIVEFCSKFSGPLNTPDVNQWVSVVMLEWPLEQGWIKVDIRKQEIFLSIDSKVDKWGKLLPFQHCIGKTLFCGWCISIRMADQISGKYLSRKETGVVGFQFIVVSTRLSLTAFTS